jgi:GH15 family glucan-1,4-alpha-glucosidase
MCNDLRILNLSSGAEDPLTETHQTKLESRCESTEGEMSLETSLLRHLIADTYTETSLSKIREVLAEHGSHRISPVANGLFAASSSQAPDSLTGYQNVWVRDNIMVADSFRRSGEFAPAVACIQGLTKFFATQLPRFRKIIADPKRVLHNDADDRPHIRFTAQTLAELPEKWTHAQNDALGEALWFRFLLANTNVLPMDPADYEIYRVFPAYFAAIKYWQDPDSGAWEEGSKINNSSVGAVLAGLEEMQKYHVTQSSGSADAAKLPQLIAKGRQRLDATLPFESPPERKVDSALLFLIHPLGVVQSREMEDAILNLVQARLKGTVGIKRYAGDSYFCQDYDEWFPPEQMSTAFNETLEFRDAHLQTDGEAQWCIFDPLLSIVYGQRFLDDRSDRASFHKQVHYFNRSLAQTTAAGACPELYFLKNGRYIPNAHTPLAWTQANQALALYLMEKSVGEN